MLLMIVSLTCFCKVASSMYDTRDDVLIQQNRKYYFFPTFSLVHTLYLYLRNYTYSLYELD